MGEREMDRATDARLSEFLAWYADQAEGRAVGDDGMAQRVRSGLQRRRAWSAGVRLVAVAAVVATLCALMVAGALLIGDRRPPLVDEAPIVDYLSDHLGEGLQPGVHAVHGFRPPFTITIPSTDGTTWTNAGVDGALVALSEGSSGNRLYIGVDGSPEETNGQICTSDDGRCRPGWPLGSTTEDAFPSSFLTRRLDDIDGGWVLVGAPTRQALDEFLPRAETVIASIDFDAAAVVATAPPGSEPLPVPVGLTERFIGHQGFDRELRYVSPSAAPPILAADAAVRRARDAYAADLAMDGQPPNDGDPIAVVRRVITGPGVGPRPVWAIAFGYRRVDGTGVLVIEFLDDRTGELVGGLSLAGVDPSLFGPSPRPRGG